MIRVHVAYGGKSAEREVSLRSGTAVATALRQAGYEVRLLDTITADIKDVAAGDVVFPALHGAGGEDGSIQAELEAHGARYVGSGPAASHLCFDKWQYRQLLAAHNLPLAAGALVQADTYASHKLAQTGYVLKPITGGSSIDTYIVRDLTVTPKKQIADTFRRYPTMLLETLIEGIELTVGILGNEPLPVIEIIPPADGEFDYENKYNGRSQELCPPLHASEAVQQAVQKLALQAHQLAGCRDFSRTDIMADAAGKLYVLETNTIPGMTDQSLFPKMAQAAGISMPELCARLVELALNR